MGMEKPTTPTRPEMPEAPIPAPIPTEVQLAAADYAVGILRTYGQRIVDLEMRLFRYEILFGRLRD